MKRTLAAKKLKVKNKRNPAPQLNSDTIVKIAKTMEHKPKPEAKELIINKRTLDIAKRHDLNRWLSEVATCQWGYFLGCPELFLICFNCASEKMGQLPLILLGSILTNPFSNSPMHLHIMKITFCQVDFVTHLAQHPPQTSVYHWFDWLEVTVLG